MPAPRRSNTGPAVAARRRAGQEAMAVKLRAAGWICTPPPAPIAVGDVIESVGFGIPATVVAVRDAEGDVWRRAAPGATDEIGPYAWFIGSQDSGAGRADTDDEVFTYAPLTVEEISG